MKVVHLMGAALLISMSTWAQTNQSKNKTSDLMKTTWLNKEVVRRIYTEALNQRKMDLLEEFVAEDYVGFRGIRGVEGFKAPVIAIITSSSDIQWEIKELVGEGDKVMVSWETQGIHDGQFQHIPATGREFTNEGMAVYEFREGKIINVHVMTDRLGFLQELGEIPFDLTVLGSNQPDKNQFIFIDRFHVPEQAKDKFVERMNINREFIRELAGFVEDAAYEQKGENGSFIIETIATWKDEKSLNAAKEAVQAEYKKEGFDPAEFMQRHGITMDRGIYRSVH